MPPEGRGAAVAAAVPHISIAQEALVSPAKRDRREARMAEIAEAVAELERHGTCWSDWARRHGFSLVATRNVLKLRHPCLRGESRRIAETILDGARWHRQPDGHAHAAPLAPETRDLLLGISAELKALQSGLDRLLKAAGWDPERFRAAGTCRSCGCTDWQACRDWDGEQQPVTEQ